MKQKQLTKPIRIDPDLHALCKMASVLARKTLGEWAGEVLKRELEKKGRK
jgi:predicted HicB family RNase H-like nuclease